MESQFIPRKNTSYLKNLLRGIVFFKELKRPHWISLLLSTICIITTISLSFMLPLALKIGVNAIEFHEASASIWWPLLLLSSYAFAWFSRQVIMQVRELCAITPFEHLVTIISRKTFNHLLDLRMSFHAHRRLNVLTGLFKKVQLNIPVIYYGVFYWVIPLFIESVGAILIVKNLYGPFFAIILTITLALYGASINYFSTITRIFRQKFLSVLSNAHSFFTDTLLHAETVKSFCREEHEINSFEKLNTQTMNAQEEYGTIHTSMHLIEAIILGTGITCFSMKAALLVQSQTFTIGDFILLNGYVLQFALPLSTLGHLLRYLQTGLIDLGSILDVLDLPTNAKTESSLAPFVPKDGKIVCKDVYFHYVDGKQLFNNFSCTIEAQKTIGIIGRSGSGKSTLARLLTKQYTPASGTILIDDQDISQINTQSLRAHIATVPQECTLFNNTIYFNISYGSPNATPHEIFDAARAAHLEHFIKKLPLQYETLIGERGLKLSGGERQRIAIARALLKKATIYIFDEATSALDNKTEQLVQQNITTWCKSATTIQIAHRLSTVTHADLLFYVENGMIAERGTHEELLEKNGLYAELWRKQQGTQNS